MIPETKGAIKSEHVLPDKTKVTTYSTESAAADGANPDHAQLMATITEKFRAQVVQGKIPQPIVVADEG
ncbi:MAG: hypothetical protein V1917_03980 [Candidatus Gottesmanbacteria bacterium]